MILMMYSALKGNFEGVSGKSLFGCVIMMKCQEAWSFPVGARQSSDSEHACQCLTTINGPGLIISVANFSLRRG